MTIALIIKVHDGLVLASDSATTLTMLQPDGTETFGNIYNNANKVFNLHKGLPVGAMTWGLGNVGPASIATLSKDLRTRFEGANAAFAAWKLENDTYSLTGVAERAREFLYGEKYKAMEDAAVASGGAASPLGFLVAGYSAGADLPEAYVMGLGSGGLPTLDEVVPGEAGASWWGQPEAIARILSGLSVATPDALVNLGIGLSIEQESQIAEGLKPQLNPQMVTPAMPIQDAVDLAEFLVHATIQFVRFSPGEPTVGGPIEIATITKHEGYKWVRRKHFYDARLNP
jgi:hypothetical protein